jgi:hypothetical protein
MSPAKSSRSRPGATAPSSAVNVAIILPARPETEIELLAAALFPELQDQPQPFPNVADLLALKRALSRAKHRKWPLS